MTYDYAREITEARQEGERAGHGPDLPDQSEYADLGGQPRPNHPTPAHAAAAHLRAKIEDPWAPHNAVGFPADHARIAARMWAEGRDAYKAAHPEPAAADAA